MLYIPNIDDYLGILTYEDVKDFTVINFSEHLNLQEKNKILEKLLNYPTSF